MPCHHPLHVVCMHGSPTPQAPEPSILNSYLRWPHPDPPQEGGQDALLVLRAGRAPQAQVEHQLRGHLQRADGSDRCMLGAAPWTQDAGP